MTRTATIKRATRETDIVLKLNLDGTGQISLATGIGFLDHMLTSLALHAGWDLDLICKGDLQVDDHHTAEDCALALGQAFNEALGTRQALVRFGSALAPLDEALCRGVVDLASRPFCAIDLQLKREMLGAIACENLAHFCQSFATEGRFCCHLDVLKGANDHHKAEAAFKALALALRQALTPTDRGNIPSTKGVL
ncbi:MAG: imidazoleglycerol-phosphate dehydratase HisB [Candidatus Krumholzibacteria bacterium]|nr:imidazoleglycerol-phosphate dehydratase HisB [Candidatus Krumholzibacteria bacterium]